MFDSSEDDVYRVLYTKQRDSFSFSVAIIIESRYTNAIENNFKIINVEITFKWLYINQYLNSYCTNIFYVYEQICSKGQGFNTLFVNIGNTRNTK